MARPAAGGHWPRAYGRSRRRARSTRRPTWLLFGVLGVALVGAGWALPALSVPPDASPSPVATNEFSAAASSRPAASPAAGPTAGSSASPPLGAGSAAPTPAARPPPGRDPLTSPAASPSPAARDPEAAPASAEEFDSEGQIIAIRFPLRESTRYRYRNNWGDLRLGAAEHYNHAHSRREGELRRAHDGIDIYARRGEPVLAPFDGVVARPKDLWQPWYPERYGKTAVIVSSELTSDGYLALLSHLHRLWVEPGQVVRRGEVIGTIGTTGNAEGGPAHVHFELRAPFPLAWQEVGRERLVDAFNPYYSLVEADPRR